MTPTEELKAEHKGVLHMLTVLEVMGEHLATGEPVASDHLAEVMDFLRVFVDQCHHGKEEEFLFPAMEKAGVPHQGGPIGAMLAEHVQGRSLVRHLGQYVEELAAGQSQAAEGVIRAAREYTELMRAHIQKEDSVLFPLAEARLACETMEELSRQFAHLEAERIGPGRHEAFHQMMERLGESYLA